MADEDALLVRTLDLLRSVACSPGKALIGLEGTVGRCSQVVTFIPVAVDPNVMEFVVHLLLVGQALGEVVVGHLVLPLLEVDLPELALPQALFHV